MTEAKMIELTADIVSAHVANNSVASGNVSTLIKSVFEALRTAVQPAASEGEKPAPAVSIRASVKPDHLVCLEDGKKMTMLKRYLRTNFDMSPADYRAKWDLPRDYPMVAPDYAEKRRGLAQAHGLGRKKVTDEVAAARASTSQTARKATGIVDAGVVQPVLEAARAGRRRLGISVARATSVAHPRGDVPANAPVAEPTMPVRKPRAKKAEGPAH